MDAVTGLANIYMRGRRFPEAEAQLRKIVAAHPDGRIAIVAHGGVLDCIYRFVRGVPLDAPRDWPLLNSSINVVDFENGRTKVVSWGDVAHLSSPGSDDDLKEVPR